MKRFTGVFFGVLLLVCLLPGVSLAHTSAPTSCGVNGWTAVAGSGWHWGQDGVNEANAIVWKGTYNGLYCGDQHGEGLANCTWSTGYCVGEPIDTDLWMYNGSWHDVAIGRCYVTGLNVIDVCNTPNYAALCGENFHTEVRIYNGGVKEIDLNTPGWTNC